MIHLCVPSVPPTVNHAYMYLKKANKRVLTEEGKRYKKETKTYIAQTYPTELKFFVPDRVYSIIISTSFKGRDSLFTKTWPEVAANRFQVLDASNRIKLFEDALSESIGLDDNHFFFVGNEKTWNAEKEETNVWVWCRDEEPDPIYELLRKLRTACS